MFKDPLNCIPQEFIRSKSHMTADWREGDKIQGLDERQKKIIWNEVPELKGLNKLREI